MIRHMRHGSPPRLMALQSILSPNRRESLPTPSAGVRMTPTSQKSYGGFLATIAALDPRLAQKIRLDDPRDEDLAPDNGGFNIEGLTARADGKSMLNHVQFESDNSCGL